jgi:beta-glucosidase
VTYNGDFIANGRVPNAFVPWTPQFPFGAGLSYSTSDMTLVSATVNASAVITVIVNVTNTGALMASKFVVGVYYSRPLSSIVRHHTRLLAFAKTDTLAPGAAQTLSVVAPVSRLASYDPDQRQLLVEPGQYTLTVGPDSVTSSGTATITI